MALSEAFIDAHITRQEVRLHNSYRASWPSRLFHHSPLENALSIINSGQILSRNDARGIAARDVAGDGVINTRDHAHRYARMYFRPKTPTQYRIEGIRRESECNFGVHAHAPVLVMFALDARRVLQLPGTKFSDQNMQNLDTEAGDTEEYFSNIPFEKVFHEGSFTDQSIKAHRHAEVLAVSPLDLASCLQRIYCRSEAERKTLLHLLDSNRWADRIDVSKDTTIFQREYAFVEEVTLSRDAIRFQLNPRRDRQPISFKLTAHDRRGAVKVRYQNESFNYATSQWWRVPAEFADGTYLVRIEIEGHLAFEAKLPLGTKLV